MDNKSSAKPEGFTPSDLLVIPLVVAGLLVTSILIRLNFLNRR